MSSWIVSEDTLRRIVCYLSSHIEDDRNTWLEQHGYVPWEHMWERKMFADMLELNCKATAYRYDEEVAIPNYEYLPYKAELIEAIVGVCCWLYQCAEGDYPDSPLYKFFDDLSKEWALDFVRATPEWASAPWE